MYNTFIVITTEKANGLIRPFKGLVPVSIPDRILNNLLIEPAFTGLPSSRPALLFAFFCRLLRKRIYIFLLTHLLHYCILCQLTLNIFLYFSIIASHIRYKIPSIQKLFHNLSFSFHRLTGGFFSSSKNPRRSGAVSF